MGRDLDVASAQAVGGAVARNPFSIIYSLPMRWEVKDKMMGYAGGLDKKLWLLNHEAAKIDRKIEVNYVTPWTEYPNALTCRKAKAELNQLEWTLRAVDIVQKYTLAGTNPRLIQNSDLRSRPFSIPADSNTVN